MGGWVGGWEKRKGGRTYHSSSQSGIHRLQLGIQTVSRSDVILLTELDLGLGGWVGGWVVDGRLGGGWVGELTCYLPRRWVRGRHRELLTRHTFPSPRCIGWVGGWVDEEDSLFALGEDKTEKKRKKKKVK